MGTVWQAGLPPVHAMQIEIVQPHPEIAPYIHQMWVFRSSSGLPSGDARVVVPNGRAKLIVSWRNRLIAAGAGRMHKGREGEIVLIGVWDQPSALSSPPADTVTIGVEFRPSGLGRFLGMDLSVLFQSIEPLDAVLGRTGADLSRHVEAADTVEEAVALVQRFLRRQLRDLARERVRPVDAALAMMEKSGFRADVVQIADALGVSRRHLLTLFQQQVGIAPKRMQSILAFERLYRQFSERWDARMLRDEALDIYFDQAHFIRNFRQMTGFTPSQFADMQNEFGRVFYNQTISRA